MLFSLPVFAAVALWKMRTEAPLSQRDRWRLVGLGLVGYYLSSFLDFLGLQYISVGLERLILFLTPTFVLLITAAVLQAPHQPRRSGWRWRCPTAASCWCSCTTCSGGAGSTVLGSLLVLGSAVELCGLPAAAPARWCRRIGSLRLVSYAMCVSSVACIAQFFVLRPASLLIQPLPVYWLSLVNGIFCTIFPVFMTMIAVQRIGAGHRLAGRHDRPGVDAVPRRADAGRADHGRAAGRHRAGAGAVFTCCR